MYVHAFACVFFVWAYVILVSVSERVYVRIALEEEIKLIFPRLHAMHSMAAMVTPTIFKANLMLNQFCQLYFFRA